MCSDLFSQHLQVDLELVLMKWTTFGDLKGQVGQGKRAGWCWGDGRGIPADPAWLRLPDGVICAKKRSSPGFQSKGWAKEFGFKRLLFFALGRLYASPDS